MPMLAYAAASSLACFAAGFEGTDEDEPEVLAEVDEKLRRICE